ncbi:MAG: hypothetical protein JWN70_1009 [Planctomycetaceae bacterium]|nr:hypothetical protein [Planctomycetaceae bacterium]
MGNVRAAEDDSPTHPDAVDVIDARGAAPNRFFYRDITRLNLVKFDLG